MDLPEIFTTSALLGGTAYGGSRIIHDLISAINAKAQEQKAQKEQSQIEFLVPQERTNLAHQKLGELTKQAEGLLDGAKNFMDGFSGGIGDSYVDSAKPFLAAGAGATAGYFGVSTLYNFLKSKAIEARMEQAKNEYFQELKKTSEDSEVIDSFCEFIEKQACELLKEAKIDFAVPKDVNFKDSFDQLMHSAGSAAGDNIFTDVITAPFGLGATAGAIIPLILGANLRRKEENKKDELSKIQPSLRIIPHE